MNLLKESNRIAKHLRLNFTNRPSDKLTEGFIPRKVTRRTGNQRKVEK